MAYIDNRFADPHRQPPDHALDLFRFLRAATSFACIAWIKTNPSPDDVALEIDAACAVLRQLAALVREECQSHG